MPLAVPEGGPQVAFCTGKSCRKSDGFSELEGALADAASSGSCELIRTRCLGECKGPVLVAHPGSADPVVLKRVRKPKQRRDLLAFLLRPDGLTERLLRRRLVGRKAQKAIERARRTP